jgi:hypothetical protein
VISTRGIQIGTLERGSWLSERLDRQGYVQAKIIAIHKVKSNFGVVLGVATSDGEDPMSACDDDDVDEPLPRHTKVSSRTASPSTGGILKLLLAALAGSKRRR